jgi:hypothetical protein
MRIKKKLLDESIALLARNIYMHNVTVFCSILETSDVGTAPS